jgi:hypothetical protein
MLFLMFTNPIALVSVGILWTLYYLLILREGRQKPPLFDL